VSRHRTELFFLLARPGWQPTRSNRPKRVCHNCDAQKACLEFALATNQESVCWGGTTEDERRKTAQAVVGRASSRVLALGTSVQRDRYAHAGPSAVGVVHTLHLNGAEQLRADDVRARSRVPGSWALEGEVFFESPSVIAYLGHGLAVLLRG